MLDAQSRETKIYFSKQVDLRLNPINDRISSLKEELQLKNDAIDKLTWAKVELMK